MLKNTLLKIPMLKKTLLNKKAMLVSLVVSSFALSAQAQNFTAADQSKFTNLCMTAISGNRAAMHNEIKNSGFSKIFIARNLQCNGENIASFVQNNGRNSENMLKVIGGGHENVSITDLAMNTDD